MLPVESPSLDRRIALAFRLVLLLYAVSWFLTNAWLADDAFITYRTIENLLSGYGLRWNPVERVQTFTHPLWLFLHVPFASIMPVEMAGFLVSFFLLILLWHVLYRCFPRLEVLCIYLMLPIWASKCISEFAASGLEVTLAFVLIALLWRQAMSETEGNEKDALKSAILFSMAALTRLDLVLLLFLPLARILARNPAPRSRLIKLTITGLIPLASWHLFALFYYGFALPNTYYAKLTTGISMHDSLRQGLHYLLDIFQKDPIAGAYLALLPVFCLWLASRWKARREPLVLEMLAWSVGALLYCGYILRVGGDFMFGRFWAPAVFVSVLMTAQFAYSFLPAKKRGVAGLVFCIFCFVVGNFQLPHEDLSVSAAGIADERAFYAKTNLLLGYSAYEHDFAKQGLRFLEMSRQGQFKVFAAGGVGMTGFFAGPTVTIVDYYALADPYLARLPVKDPKQWRVGHYERSMPDGYLSARANGNFRAMDSGLAEYFGVIHELVSGPLFSMKRLQNILLFNLGRYDNLRDDHLRLQKATRE